MRPKRISRKPTAPGSAARGASASPGRGVPRLAPHARPSPSGTARKSRDLAHAHAREAGPPAASEAPPPAAVLTALRKTYLSSHLTFEKKGLKL